jgi:tetratricopeptide (TPR) repeat protein
MNFRDFAQILFPFYADGRKKPAYVIMLIDSFMEEPSTPDDIQKAENGEYNPLVSLQKDTLNRIYKGERKIKSEYASIILRHMDKQRFDEFINKPSFDSLESVCVELSKHGIVANPQNAGKVCSGLFEKVLKLCASETKAKRTSKFEHEESETQRKIDSCHADLTQIDKMIAKCDSLRQSFQQPAISIEYFDEIISVSAQFHINDDVARGAVYEIMELCKEITKTLRCTAPNPNVTTGGKNSIMFVPNMLYIFEQKFISFFDSLRETQNRLRLKLDKLYASESHDQKRLNEQILIEDVLRKPSTEFANEIAPQLPVVKKSGQIINLSGFFISHIPAKEFINRDAPREAFYGVLNNNPPFKQNVIMYYGIGGIGKSSLMRNLKEYTESQSILFSSVDFDDPAMHSPYKALIELEKKLNTTLPHFDIAVTLCFIKRNPEFSFRDSGLPNAISREALRLLKSSCSASFYSIASGLTALIYREFRDKLGLDESLKDQLATLEERSAADIEEQLSMFFAVDLYRHMAIEGLDKCVLFFDTYELLWHEGRGIENKLRNDAWIRTMADKLKNVLFILSGREKLQWELENQTWTDRVNLVPLDVLAPEYAQQYLLICKIEDGEIQKGIITAAQGHPYYLDLCVDTYYKLLGAGKPLTPDSFGGGFQEIQERFFRSLDKSEIFVLRILSVPRVYDFEIFEILNSRFQTGYSTAYFDVFNAYSFIKHEPNSKYIIHILMRDEIKKHIDKELKRAIDSSMIGYFKEKLSLDKIPVDDVRYYFSELLFHLNESKSQEQILSCVEAEYIGIVKRLQISGETKYLLGQFLALFNTHRETLGGSEFFAVMTDMIHLSGNYREAVALMTEYLNKFQIDEIARSGYCLNLYIRRTHHQMFYVPLQSIYDDLNKVIDLVDRDEFVSHYCEILFMLGAHIYLPAGDFEKTRETLKKMNDLASKHSLNGLLCRGLRKHVELLCACGNFDTAEEVCLDALHIASDNALWRYEFYLHCILGEIKRLTGKTDDALKQFNEVLPTAMSLGIKGWIGHVNLALGNCHTDLGDFEPAFKRFENARNIYSEIGQKWGELNLETAYQRTLLLSAGANERHELERLKQESDTLGYAVLSSKIEGLMTGDKTIIRFEYL